MKWECYFIVREVNENENQPETIINPETIEALINQQNSSFHMSRFRANNIDNAIKNSLRNIRKGIREEEARLKEENQVTYK